MKPCVTGCTKHLQDLRCRLVICPESIKRVNRKAARHHGNTCTQNECRNQRNDSSARAWNRHLHWISVRFQRDSYTFIVEIRVKLFEMFNAIVEKSSRTRFCFSYAKAKLPIVYALFKQRENIVLIILETLSRYRASPGKLSKRPIKNRIDRRITRKIISDSVQTWLQWVQCEYQTQLHVCSLLPPGPVKCHYGIETICGALNRCYLYVKFYYQHIARRMSVLWYRYQGKIKVNLKPSHLQNYHSIPVTYPRYPRKTKTMSNLE